MDVMVTGKGKGCSGSVWTEWLSSRSTGLSVGGSHNSSLEDKQTRVWLIKLLYTMTNSRAMYTYLLPGAKVL